MSSPTSQIECRFCKTMVSIKVYKKHHGKWNPYCLYIRTWQKLREDEWYHTGKYERVLDLAGVTKQRPIDRPYYWAQNPDWSEFLFIPKWLYTPCVVFGAAAPMWAVKLAQRLTSDQEFIKKVGGRARKTKTPVWKPKSKRYVTEEVIRYELPIAERALVIRAAAESAMTREFMDDDLEAAMILLKGTK